MHKNIKELFENLWLDYIQVTPTAQKIHELLGSKESDDIINDHIALRTFNIDKVNLEKLALSFKILGYKECGEYFFKEKKLYAKHFEHDDKTMPKVFISQLLIEEFSKELQDTIHDLVDQVDEKAVYSKEFLHSGRHWDIDSKTYERLLKQSEYAAWMYIWGYRANHFTVSINHLKNYESLEAVNTALKENGFALNDTGGEIKGSKEVLLEQSSTLADKVLVEFKDKSLLIPSCFYEFALRYPDSSGELYSGFVAASADKIFESTNQRE